MWEFGGGLRRDMGQAVGGEGVCKVGQFCEVEWCIKYGEMSFFF